MSHVSLQNAVRGRRPSLTAQAQAVRLAVGQHHEPLHGQAQGAAQQAGWQVRSTPLRSVANPRVLTPPLGRSPSRSLRRRLPGKWPTAAPATARSAARSAARRSAARTSRRRSRRRHRLSPSSPTHPVFACRRLFASDVVFWVTGKLVTVFLFSLLVQDALALLAGVCPVFFPEFCYYPPCILLLLSFVMALCFIIYKIHQSERPPPPHKLLPMPSIRSQCTPHPRLPPSAPGRRAAARGARWPPRRGRT